ncbi:MAG: branched-chain amino acid ABC transporter permease, partial [Candidatus Geothermincolales bacterium]
VIEIILITAGAGFVIGVLSLSGLGFNLTLALLQVGAGSLVILLLLQWFIKRTRLGIAIEAMAQDREGASLVGINVNRISALTFAIASALAGVAAVLMAPLGAITPEMGGLLILKAFVIVVIGGLGSIKGAIAGGYLLGIIEALGVAYISSTYKDVFAFALLIIILAVRPTGLFGERAA